MAKLAPTSTKYVIRAQIKAKGVVEKPDIIGAVFGQTEGLLGNELDLRELQRTGRIGRIDVKIESKNGNSTGEIIIPSSLDASETALIAATLETIERVGPCTADIKLLEVEDTRSDKRKYVVDKAKDILQKLSDSGVPDSNEISEQIKEAVRVDEVTEVFGLPSGPAVLESDDIIIVEGRADVITLLRYGVRNAVAIEGTSVSPEIAELAKRKAVTLFIDGDRGGKLIAKELGQMIDIDYIAQAPENKEVEELGKKEIFKALRDKLPADQFADLVAGKRVRKTTKKEEPEPETKPVRTTTSRTSSAQRASAPSRSRAPVQSRFESVPSRYPSSPRRDSRGSSRDSRGSSRGYSRDSRGGRSDSRSYSRDSRGGSRGYSRDSRGGRSDSRFGRSDRREFSPSPRPRARLTEGEKSLFIKTLKELEGTKEACIFNDKNELMGKVPVTELESTIKTVDDPRAVIMDGKVDYKISEASFRKGVKFLVGTDKEDLRTSVTVLSKKDLEA